MCELELELEFYGCYTCMSLVGSFFGAVKKMFQKLQKARSSTCFAHNNLLWYSHTISPLLPVLIIEMYSSILRLLKRVSSNAGRFLLRAYQRLHMWWRVKARDGQNILIWIVPKHDLSVSENCINSLHSKALLEHAILPTAFTFLHEIVFCCHVCLSCTYL